MKTALRILLLAFVAIGTAATAEARDNRLRDDCAIDSRRISINAWPQTDFSRCTIDISEILSGGPGKDGIPALDQIRVIDVAAEDSLSIHEPVISLSIDGTSRAWPLRYLIWHEIANDTLAGVPIAVTYCPLCNAAIVFDRRLDGQVLDFGTTGNLRKSDLVMYDRQTESWWQQYTGEAIIGTHAGRKLDVLASRLESWWEFRQRHPGGTVLVPTSLGSRPYGANPYAGYDTSGFPFLYEGEVPQGIAPLARVVVVEGQAWSLALLREKGSITSGDLMLTWMPGQRSALDRPDITAGRMVGTVTAQRQTGDGAVDVPYDVTFAFVFHAFTPEGKIIGAAQ